ncbi:hypothetical protein DUI87_22464 [Hirundo rustica rustica]|uniref:Uncharacterized protein n=1 Tax=Hirundo rustica rustica TaxID=333673 RepID=A0A3M0JPV7_HIRRU|nr:hypothetical protein DUI87_22464 [Hirundo rustica rustica]
MAGPRLLPPGLPLLLLLLLPLLPLLRLSPGEADPSRCRPDEFQCAPGALCFPQDWRCDGHPDCEDDEDERGCETATAAEPSPGGPAVTPLRSSAVPPAVSTEPAATPEPEVSVPSSSQGYTWILIVAVVCRVGSNGPSARLRSAAEERDVIQRDLQANRNLMKFDKVK